MLVLSAWIILPTMVGAMRMRSTTSAVTVPSPDGMTWQKSRGNSCGLWLIARKWAEVPWRTSGGTLTLRGGFWRGCGGGWGLGWSGESLTVCSWLRARGGLDGCPLDRSCPALDASMLEVHLDRVPRTRPRSVAQLHGRANLRLGMEADGDNGLGSRGQVQLCPARRLWLLHPQLHPGDDGHRAGRYLLNVLGLVERTDVIVGHHDVVVPVVHRKHLVSGVAELHLQLEAFDEHVPADVLQPDPHGGFLRLCGAARTCGDAAGRQQGRRHQHQQHAQQPMHRSLQ